MEAGAAAKAEEDVLRAEEGEGEEEDDDEKEGKKEKEKKLNTSKPRQQKRPAAAAPATATATATATAARTAETTVASASGVVHRPPTNSRLPTRDELAAARRREAEARQEKKRIAAGADAARAAVAQQARTVDAWLCVWGFQKHAEELAILVEDDLEELLEVDQEDADDEIEEEGLRDKFVKAARLYQEANGGGPLCNVK